jgi:hypothetical protein
MKGLQVLCHRDTARRCSVAHTTNVSFPPTAAGNSRAISCR